jgi:chromosome segregation ATPase
MAPTRDRNDGLLAAELAEAERDARGAAERLVQAFAEKEQLLQQAQEKSAARAGAQAQMQSAQLRVEQLRREHAQARWRLDGADKEP